ncbi:MAG: hypothetical protein UT55_C0017G0005 [Candidatus Peregrinibacteria bacterium GW2011_GWE2_39_6]|nr:MAG: hypothetical protein UT36_C0004G0019 [Candidatus Peregrinibacteria bacterium GW2011_GWF2_39_17]KKR26109.1 MAG: hypothetical protein UT55_C0017G0005 [Candidatus Peregrinibacteria bacterium GW2011_GWE2_39_6]HCW32694.1 hypothetical protein [Candidatus Peregrinibacteria bacterium]
MEAVTRNGEEIGAPLFPEKVIREAIGELASNAVAFQKALGQIPGFSWGDLKSFDDIFEIQGAQNIEVLIYLLVEAYLFLVKPESRRINGYNCLAEVLAGYETNWLSISAKILIPGIGKGLKQEKTANASERLVIFLAGLEGLN